MPRLTPDDLHTEDIKVTEADHNKLKKWMTWNWETVDHTSRRGQTAVENKTPRSWPNERQKTLITMIVVLSLVMLLIGIVLGGVI